MGKSKIEWTERTWNPTTGCKKISQGCKFCYAETFTKRLKAMGLQKYKNGFEIALHPSVLKQPYSWRPSLIFVNSMSDLFHEKVPYSFIKQVFHVMVDCPQHNFQILTKRAERLEALAPSLPWPKNVWIGVSIENKDNLFRIKHLRHVDASIKFLSIEPLLGPLGCIDLEGVNWVIVGGESGPKARPMKESWVIDIKKQCDSQNVPFFFKQWGGTSKKKNGRLLNGKVYNHMPKV